MTITINHRWEQRVLWQGEAETIKNAVIAALEAWANLSGADLSWANLSGADLWRANLWRANLSGANLSRANLWGANLSGVDLSGANLSGADLSGANLSGANLWGANLWGSDLSGANLWGARNIVLPTGETWADYLTQTVPALLTAGGKSLESFASHWQCHSWDNCPMAFAFDAGGIDGVPLLLRPRAEQFIQFFDAGVIPWPLPTAADFPSGADVVVGGPTR